VLRVRQIGHGGNVWLAQHQYKINVENIIDFSANINPLGPSPGAVKALEQQLANICHYPEPQAETLRQEIGRVTGLPEENLILGNGAAELIYALGRVLQPRRVLLPVPTFSEYAEGLAGSQLVPFNLSPENDFKLDVEQLGRLLQPGDLIIICNPNNPTGQLVQANELKSLLQRARELGAWLTVDEAFMDFVQPEQSLLANVTGNHNLLVLRSLTKFYAIPGLRLGYLAAATALIEKFTAILPPWRVNTLAQLAGLASLADRQYRERTLALLNVQRQFLTSGLARVPGLRPLISAANFILVDCSKSGCTGSELQNYLGPKGLLIRLCHNFAGLGNSYFRVAVRSEEENKLLLQHLRDFMSACGR